MSHDTPTSPPLIGLPSNPLISCAEDSRAKICPSQENEQASTAPEAASGLNMSDAYAHYDRATSVWRTSQVCLITQQWDVYSETWPSAGTMRNGVAFRQPTWAPRTSARESGLWPTPRNCSAMAATITPSSAWKENRFQNLETVVGQMMWPTPTASDADARQAKAGTCYVTANRTLRRRNKDGTTSNMGLSGQMFPTPTVADSKRAWNFGRGEGSPTLAGFVKSWPTPSSNNVTGGATGLGDGSGNRKKPYAMLGETDGKKMDYQSLNPYWVEWLMGFPIGWLD